MSTDAERKEIIRSIIRAYDRPLVRLYGTIRCLILHQRFLEEIGQYFPDSGTVLDIGCGYGLFAHYYASRFPQLAFRAVDLNARRIESATRASRRLKLTNVEFTVGDAREFTWREPIRGAYMMDLIHHIPAEAVPQLVKTLADRLQPGCRLMIKDIDTRPWYKLAYTFMLDKLMDYRAPVCYWSASQVRRMLTSIGLDVHEHRMLGYLPSPHIVYIATSKEQRSS